MTEDLEKQVDLESSSLPVRYRERKRSRRIRKGVERGRGTRMGAPVGWCNFRLYLAIVFAASITAAGLLGFHKPLLNGCIMTYMYPTYIPLPRPSNATNNKYSLHLYHEGWKKIDHHLHLVKLSGVPVLFIPGNGGSYKQVRTFQDLTAFYCSLLNL